ncbi:amino acid adenylation domain-containing protein [Amycolatopsis sp. NPDC004079]|uniref:amino acid adenylation domain-containing protein n=1 Tax=Amycolatopsis sp. NPDC004079 TaxID=3154549 RepID=UPI0033ABCF3E
MTVGGLVTELEAVGVRLWEESGQLRFRAPRGVLTEERKQALRARKAEVLAHLRADEVTVQPRPEAWHEPFPLTDVQASYLLGRHSSFAYGGTGCHGYGELSYRELDAAALETAWRKVIERHDMLRAVVRADGVQQVLPQVPEYRVEVDDLRGAGEERLAEIRARMDHKTYDPGVWPLFELRVVRTGDADLLLFSIDFMICDFVSIQLLLDELHRYYADPAFEQPPLEITYRDYLFADRGRGGGSRYERDRAYWTSRVGELPPAPDLPLREDHRSAPPRFRRLATALDPREWAELRRRAGAHSVSPSGAVLAAYAEVIGRWSRNPRFTLDLTLLNRPPAHPQVNSLVGDFTSVNLLAVDPAPEAVFAERAGALQARLWQDLDHALYSGIEVIRELARRRGAAEALMPVVFTSAIGLGAQDDPDDPAADGRLVGGISQTPQVWIDCQNIERGGGLSTNWDVREGVLPEQVVEDMFSAYEALLRRLATSDDAWADVSPLELPRAQLDRRAEVNSTAGPLPETLLHEQVLAQAKRTPELPAVITGGVSVSYRDLSQRVHAVVNWLRAEGTEPGDLVGIVMDKGVEQVAAALGVLCAGAAYVPIDTVQPAARRDAMLANAGIRRVLTQSWLAPAGGWPENVRLCAVDSLAPQAEPEEPLPRRSLDDLAYVIYTSGSTGTPKGVMISHRGARNTVDDLNRRFEVTERDRVLGLAGLGFDLSVYDIFGPLSRGGCLVLPDPGRRGDPSHWADLVAAHEVTIWNSVPAQMQMLLDYLRVAPGLGLPSLRLSLLSGDWIPVTLPAEQRALLPRTAQISLGGATEASIWSIWHPIGEVGQDWRSIPYGTPLTNQTFHVLDSALRPRPDLVPGQLYIGGTGVALGYLGDPELTSARFMRHPQTGERLYATGDLGRYRPDGVIEFLGREDFQVKIRGHRIELAEVEAELSRHPAVGGAAALVHGRREAERRLVAFVQTAVAADSPSPAPDFRRTVPPAGDRLLADVDLERYQEYIAALDRVALLTMFDVLRAAGLFSAAAEGHTVDEILTTAKVTPAYHRLVRRWLAALREAGMLRREAESGRFFADTPEPRFAPDAEWARVDRLREHCGESAALVDYFRQSGDRLPSLLRGELDPVRLLFPEGRVELSSTLYGEALFNRWANEAAAAAVREIATAAPGVPVRVLEVGAGTGSASAPVLDALAGFDADYLFTDLSQFFLNTAGKRFADRPWVNFQVYDLDCPYRTQGLRSNSFDVVFAADVLHTTTDVDRVLVSLRELLVPGGWLVFVEMVRDHSQIMTSLELMTRVDESAGDFTDERRGRDQTFLSRKQWERALAAAGAELCACLPEDGVLAELGVTVFVARMKTDRVPLEVSELGEQVAERLPDYMVPGDIQVVDALPLTGNGKIDRAALRSWLPGEGEAAAPAGSVEPRGDLERRIARQWCELLRVDRAGRTDDFFALGGDSLLAAQLAGQLVERVPELSEMYFDQVLRLILEGRTIEALVGHLDGTESGPAVETGEPRDPLVTLNEGDGVPVVLVPDTAGGLLPATAFGTRTPSLGLVITDRAGCLARDPAILLESLAADFVRALREAGHSRVRLAARRAGAPLCVEVARQLVEVGAEVEQVVLVAADPPACEVDDEILAEYLFAAEQGIAPEKRGAPLPEAMAQAIRTVLAETPGRVPADRLRDLAGTPELDAVAAWARDQSARPREERLAALAPGSDGLVERCDLFWQLWSAAVEHEMSWYAGDLTVYSPREPEPLWQAVTRPAEGYWAERCLGDVRETEIGGTAYEPRLPEAIGETR